MQNHLMDLDGESFVREAYHRILGRAPDANGLSNYLELLNKPGGKAIVVMALSDSDEARKRAQNHHLLALRHTAQAWSRVVPDQSAATTALEAALTLVYRELRRAEQRVQELESLNAGRPSPAEPLVTILDHDFPALSGPTEAVLEAIATQVLASSEAAKIATSTPRKGRDTQ
jgi:hypothetical protein